MEWAGVITRLFAITNPKGYLTDEVEKAKGVYGGLPNILEQFYLQLGCSDELSHGQDYMMLPGKYPVFNDFSHLVFFNENQGVCQAGIALNDIEKDDPPVYVGYEDAGWIKTSDSLSGFLVAMFGYQAACWGLNYAAEEIYMITENDLEFIEQHFVKQREFLKNWFYFKVELYANSHDERIAVLNLGGNDLQMLYAANNQNAFNKMQNVLKNVGEPM